MYEPHLMYCFNEVPGQTILQKCEECHCNSIISTFVIVKCNSGFDHSKNILTIKKMNYTQWAALFPISPQKLVGWFLCCTILEN